MARLPRIVIPGVPHHVTQRGNRRQRVFFTESDYRLYLELLDEWRILDEVAILSYCLMPNHVHILAVPSTEISLTHAISEIHRRYSQAINRKKRWVGHLWQGRYSSFPMSESHLRQALYYVEYNPVRASLVSSPELWKWGSAHEHAGLSDFSIADHLLLHRLTAAPTQASAIEPEVFTSHAKTGRPLGSEEWVRKLEVITGRDLLPKRPGRKSKPPK